MPLNVNKIRKLMAGKSQSEVAASAGMAQPNLARLLAGRSSPTLATVERLAKALQCEARDILR